MRRFSGALALTQKFRHLAYDGQPQAYRQKDSGDFTMRDIRYGSLCIFKIDEMMEMDTLAIYIYLRCRVFISFD